jgi:hypothetical protein
VWRDEELCGKENWRSMRWVMLQKWVVKGEHMGELLFKNFLARHLD